MVHVPALHAENVKPVLIVHGVIRWLVLPLCKDNKQLSNLRATYGVLEDLPHHDYITHYIPACPSPVVENLTQREGSLTSAVVLQHHVSRIKTTWVRMI